MCTFLLDVKTANISMVKFLGRAVTRVYIKTPLATILERWTLNSMLGL